MSMQQWDSYDLVKSYLHKYGVHKTRLSVEQEIAVRLEGDGLLKGDQKTAKNMSVFDLFKWDHVEASTCPAVNDMAAKINQIIGDRHVVTSGDTVRQPAN